MRAGRIVDRTLGAALVAFLVVADVELAPSWPWQAARLALLGVALAAAAAVVVRRPPVLRALTRPPLAYFSAFAALAIAAAAGAEHPLPALRYAFGYVAVAAAAAAAAAVFAERALVAGLMLAAAAKLALSLALVASPAAWWSDARFMGVLGSPNPMGAAAGLAYLLVVLHGWYDWPRARSRLALAACGVAATTTMAITRSLSAVVATLLTLVVLAPFSGMREGSWRQRAGWAALAVAMLAPVAVVLGGPGGPTRGSTPSESMDLRLGWWAVLIEAVWKHPWLGYGAGSTPGLGIPDAPPWGTSAHNLYIEAAVYAGIPAALVMALFVCATLVAAVKEASRARPRAGVGLAVAAVFYAVLSLGEPVVLNAAPSTLVVPLVVAAVCAARAGRRPPSEGRRAGPHQAGG